MGLSQYTKKTYSKQDKDKLWDDFKYLVYYMLLWIACVDDYCRIY